MIIRKFKFVLLSILFCVATPAKAETVQIPTVCGSTDEILGPIKDWEQKMVFMGNSINTLDQNLYVTVWTNPETLTWTTIVTNKELGTSCVLSFGTGYQFFAEHLAI